MPEIRNLITRFVIPILEKARRNPKLVPKKMVVTREGTAYSTTVWVLPGEAAKEKPLGVQLDMFAEAEIDEISRREKIISHLQHGATVSFRSERGKQLTGVVRSFAKGMFSISVDRHLHYVKPEDIGEIVPEKEPAKIAELLAKVSPETRAATEAQLFGSTLEEKATEAYEFEPRRSGGAELEYLDFMDVIPLKIGLIPENGILAAKRPGWIPPLDDQRFSRFGNRLEAVKMGDDDYMIVLSSGNSEHPMFARVGGDVLAATQDYYLKRAKALEKERTLKKESLFPGGKFKVHPIRTAGVTTIFRNTVILAESKLGVRSHGEAQNAIIEASKDMKQKLSDMNIQIEENYSAYAKGQETAYGNKGTRKDLLDEYGVLVKRQNGDAINPREIQDIKTALDSVYGVYGNRSSMAKAFGLKVSHSGKTLMHAMNASGVYFPARRAIGVTMRNGEMGFGFTLAHEWAHFMDNYLGSKGARHFYASDDWSSLPGQIARTFRSNMASPQKSDYQNRTCECFARALEQFFATKKGNQAEYQAAWNGKGNHPRQSVFEERVLPLVERFFQEDDELLKALRLSRSLTWSGHKLQGRMTLHGMEISIENRKGSVRRGVDKDGHEWETKMHHAYGYVRGTVGKDKDHLDCYVGPNPESKKVFVVHQNDPVTGEYDEDKTMLAFDSAAEAKAAYLKQYDRPGFFGSMDETSIDAFKREAFKKANHGKKLIVR